MTTPVITILDTTVAENGAVQTVDFPYLKNDVERGGTRFFVDIGAGDTVVIEGKAAAADSNYRLLATAITASGVYDVKLSPVFRARRSVDGGGADSLVRVINLDNHRFVTHSA